MPQAATKHDLTIGAHQLMCSDGGSCPLHLSLNYFAGCSCTSSEMLGDESFPDEVDASGSTLDSSAMCSSVLSAYSSLPSNACSLYPALSASEIDSRIRVLIA